MPEMGVAFEIPKNEADGIAEGDIKVAGGPNVDVG